MRSESNTVSVPFRFMITFLAVVCSACASGMPARTPAKTVLSWTVGAAHLPKPPSPDSILDQIPGGTLKPKPSGATKPNSQRPVGAAADSTTEALSPADLVTLSECIRATSLLPTSWNGGRIFLLSDGIVHLFDRTNRRATPLGGITPDMHIEQLLAYRTNGENVEVLVSASKDGALDIYTLHIQETSIIRTQIADLNYRQPAEFFRAYRVPRCSSEGNECLTARPDDDSAHIERWSALVSGSVELAPAIDGAKDVAWSQMNDGSMYILVDCPSTTQSSR